MMRESSLINVNHHTKIPLMFFRWNKGNSLHASRTKLSLIAFLALIYTTYRRKYQVDFIEISKIFSVSVKLIANDMSGWPL